MRKPVTREDRERIENMFVTMTAKEISVFEGRPLGGIKEILRYSDVRKNRKYTVDDMRLVASDLSTSEVARLLDRTRKEINNKRWLMRNAEAKREKPKNQKQL